MAPRTSRYANTPNFALDASGARVFAGIRPRELKSPAGVLEHTVKAEDRLDLLARYYYGDDRKWWRILDANPQFLFGPDMTLREMQGRTIVIPAAED